MLLLLVHDHLFGKGVQCGGPLKQIIVRHKTRLQGELVKLKVRRKAKRNEDLIPAVLRKSVERAALMPRYVRVNLVKSTVKEGEWKCCLRDCIVIQIADLHATFQSLHGLTSTSRNGQ